MKTPEQLYAFILTSKVRRKVLRILNQHSPLRQTEIADKINQKQPNISLILRDLEKEGLIECLTPDKKAWKVYKITKIGKEVINQF